jgi:hypothetical protein
MVQLTRDLAQTKVREKELQQALSKAAGEAEEREVCSKVGSVSSKLGKVSTRLLSARVSVHGC